MRFEKWQALGNDYVILERERLPWELDGARVRRICDPHFGIGADGVLLLSRSEDPAFAAELRIFFMRTSTPMIRPKTLPIIPATMKSQLKMRWRDWLPTIFSR
jgi:hypothetical protein